MKRSLEDAPAKKVDDALTILGLFDGDGFAFDFVGAMLDGVHPLVVNELSDRAYFVLEGEGTITVSGTVYAVSANDLVVIKAGEPHGLDGRLKYLIVTSPPFAPENEHPG